MRKCKGKFWDKNLREFKDFTNGCFHQWGINYTEFDNGLGHYTAAVVELQDGKVIMANPDDIQFTETDLKK